MKQNDLTFQSLFSQSTALISLVYLGQLGPLNPCIILLALTVSLSTAKIILLAQESRNEDYSTSIASALLRGGNFLILKPTI